MQEFAKLPLRMSRQLNLALVNNGLSFIASSIRAKASGGYGLSAPGAQASSNPPYMMHPLPRNANPQA